jgi:hypothetical protein
MRTHSRIRKTLKWIALGLTVALVGVWIWSEATFTPPLEAFGVTWSADTGRVYIASGKDPRGDAVELLVAEWDDHGDTSRWRFRRWVNANGDWVVAIPFAVVTGSAGAATAIAWFLDHRARRRAREGACPNCGYSLAGLTANAPCPECGAIDATRIKTE